MLSALYQIKDLKIFNRCQFTEVAESWYDDQQIFVDGLISLVLDDEKKAKSLV